MYNKSLIFPTIHLFIVGYIIGFNYNIMGLFPEQYWGGNYCCTLNKYWSRIVSSLDNYFVGSWFVFVYNFSDCELPFKANVICNQTRRQKSGRIRNIQIRPKNSFIHCWIYYYVSCQGYGFIIGVTSRYKFLLHPEYSLKLDSFIIWYLFYW